MFQGKKGLRIEVPSEISAGDTLKIVVTYNEYPASKAQLTFEGAVIDPVKTDNNGGASIKVPNVSKPANVKIHIRYRFPWPKGSYSLATIAVLPKKEAKERDVKEGSQTLFKGQIRIAADNYWADNYKVGAGNALLISVKTDGRAINGYILDKNSYQEYTTNRTARSSGQCHYNIIEGEYAYRASPSDSEECYIVLENPHKEAVSASVNVSKIYTA